MNSANTINRSPPPDWLAVEPHVARFEDAFRRGELPSIAEHLPAPDDPLRDLVLVELMRVDLELRREHGHRRNLEEYRREFPDIFADPEAVSELAFEEYRLRAASGESVKPSEYAHRFSIDASDWPAIAASSNDPRQSTSADGHGRDSAPVCFPETGEVFCGFVLTHTLGQGAFGRVYAAQQCELADRPVVLKVTRDIGGESQRLARLQHAAIVPIFSVHAHQGLHAFVMPYCGRATLENVLRQWGARETSPKSGEFIAETIRDVSTFRVGDDLAVASHTEQAGATAESPMVAFRSAKGRAAEASPEGHALLRSERRPWSHLETISFSDAVLWIIAELADGLAHAHRRGIVHRDIKPANILLADDGQPMLLDFHLAADTRERFDLSRDFVGGTLPYMAPEQIRELLDRPTQPDARSDIYSLGVVLCELLFKQLPHRAVSGDTWRATARQWLEAKEHEPLAPSLLATVSPDVASIVGKCLAREPGDRYQSADELREDLRCQLEHRPLRHAPNVSVVQRIRKFSRRHPRLSSATSVSAIAVALLVACAAMLAGAWRQMAVSRAEAGFVEATRDLQTAFFTLPGIKQDATRDQAAREACDRLEQRYGVFSKSDWLASPAAARLTTEHRVELRQRVGELLALWQRSLIHGAQRAPDADQAAKLRAEARLLGERALACFDPNSPPTVLRRWQQRLEVFGTGMPPSDPAESNGTFDEILLALDEIDSGRLQAAADRLRMVTRSAPRHHIAWSLLGHCLLQLGKFGDAERALTVCIGLWPDAAWAYADRGVALKESRQWDEAIADLSQAIELDRSLLHATINRGIAQMERGYFAEAHADFDAAITRLPKSARLRFLKAEAYSRQGDPQSAGREQSLAMALPPDDEICWTVRGVAHLTANDPLAALADFDRALSMNPWLAAARQNKAHVLSEMLKKPEKAIQELTTLLESQPDFAPALRGRGVLYARLGRRDEAISDAKRALAFDASPQSLYQIGGIYATTSAVAPDDRAEAMRLLSLALQQGYGLELLDHDPELDSLRQDDDFRRLVATARQRAASVSSAHTAK